MANGKLKKQIIFLFPIIRKKNYSAFQNCKNYDNSISRSKVMLIFVNVSFSKKSQRGGGLTNLT